MEEDKKTAVSRRAFLKSIGIMGGGLVLTSFAPASLGAAPEIYPNRKITWIVPYPAGGGYDIIARGVSRYVAEYLQMVHSGDNKIDILVKNILGAGAIKGHTTLYNADPDGYTIGTCNPDLITETTNSKLDFDPLKFNYFIRIGKSKKVLLTNNNSGINSWKDIVKLAQKGPVKWGAGTFGGNTHVSSILIIESTGLPVKFINSSSNVQSLNGLLRGDFPLALTTEESSRSLIDAKEVKLITVFADKSEYPGVPDIKSLGYPQLAEIISNQRFIATPPGTPDEIGNVLESAFRKTMTNKDFLAWAEKTGVPVDPIYGKESNALARGIIKTCLDKMPIIKKYLR